MRPDRASAETDAATAPSAGTTLTAERSDPAEPLITLDDVQVHYALGGSSIGRLVGRSTGVVKALDGVSLQIVPGEVVGLVGESGSGKSTLGRAILGLAPVTGGAITHRGRTISGLGDKHLRPVRRKLQMIFQDPAAALNPTMTVGQGIADALRIHRVPAEARADLVERALDRVGLSPVARFAARYPSELSGGQKQRAVIARAICLDPELLVADEPISMLDMSVRAKILTLLSDLRRDLGIAFLYITHDLASARFFCDRVAIMYLGKIVEIGPTEEIFADPRHPYTRALLRAVPDVSHRRDTVTDLPRGEIPDAARPPLGCSFHPRCPLAFDRCGWEGRDVRTLLESRWTTVDLPTYEKESALVGDLGATRTDVGPDGASSVIPTSRPTELAEVLTGIQAENPDEPFFSAVRRMEPVRGGLRLELAAFETPALRHIPGGHVAVACHLHDPDRAPDGRSAVD